MWIQVLTLLNSLSDLGPVMLYFQASISSSVKWANNSTWWQVVSEKHERFEIRYARFKYWLPLVLKPQGISVFSFIE